MQLCYSHLPIIQNGIAILSLNRLGYAEDERVINACDNLFFLYKKYGGWCNSNIRDAFIAEMKRREKLKV